MAGNQRVRQTGTREPITRKREGGTLKGCSYRVVQPEWSGVTRNKRTNTRDRGEIEERSRVDRVPKGTESGRMICIASLNIKLGRVGGLETVLCALQQGNIGIGDLYETKLTRGIHTRLSSGYKL